MAIDRGGGAVVVQGLADMQRAFAKAGKAATRELRTELRAVAEPIRLDVERRAVTEIDNIGRQWSQMRVGVTRKSVYVAPRQRGRNSRTRVGIRRPNLKTLLLDRALEPALDGKTPEIAARMEKVLATVGKEWERG